MCRPNDKQGVYIKRNAIWKSLSLVLTETHGEKVNTLSLPRERDPPRKEGGAGPDPVARRLSLTTAL